LVLQNNDKIAKHQSGGIYKTVSFFLLTPYERPSRKIYVVLLLIFAMTNPQRLEVLNSMKKTLFVLGLVAIMAGASAFATTPLGGLAIDLSPAGDVLVCAGDNRVMYIMDAAKMEVTKRIWLGVDAVNLKFNGQGSNLVIEDTDGTLHLLDSKSWQPYKRQPKAQQMTTAGSVDLAAGLNPDYNGHIIRFLSMTDLSDKGQITFPKTEKVQSFGLNAKGDRLAVLMESVDDPTEPKGEKPPADLKDLALDEFRLKNDGKTAVLKVFAAPDGKTISEQKLYYSAGSNGSRLFFQADSVLVVNYTNLNAVIDPKGAVTLFKLGNSYNYGLGFSNDHSILLSGGLSDGIYTKIDGLAQVRFQPDRMAGWPEYFKSFTIAGDGTAYGATSGYRVIKIKPGGIFEKSVPVF
jgi:hypothetical protein